MVGDVGRKIRYLRLLKIFFASATIATAAFLIPFLLQKYNVVSFEALSTILFASVVIYIMFVMTYAFLITSSIRSRVPTATGAICLTFVIYTLVIYSFGALYYILSVSHPDYFSECPLDFLNASYFSVTTLTTVGYGDIVPKGHIARGLAALEMLIGLVLNLTIFAVTAGYVAEQISAKREAEKPNLPPQ